MDPLSKERSRKRICYVTTVAGTMRSFVVPVVSQIKKQVDWDITLVCADDGRFSEEVPEGIDFTSIKMTRGISLNGAFATARLYRFFQKNHFDLIQYSTPNASLYASIAAWLARIPVRLYCQWGIAYVGFEGLTKIVFKAIEKMVCKLSTCIEPDSFGNLDFSCKEGLYSENKGSVVWNGSASGIDLSKFDYSRRIEWRSQVRIERDIPNDCFVYLFVGRITGDKGINELLEAYRQISASEKIDTRLMLCGSIEKENSLNHGLFDWARQSSDVIFCGRVDDVERYMASADVYVLPSYREGFGSAVVEAEAMGTPVIVTDIPGPTDAMLPRETGLLVEKKDVQSLKRAMLEISSNPSLHSAMSEKCHEFASAHFDQRELVKRIIEDRARLMGA